MNIKEEILKAFPGMKDENVERLEQKFAPGFVAIKKEDLKAGMIVYWSDGRCSEYSGHHFYGTEFTLRNIYSEYVLTNPLEDKLKWVESKLARGAWSAAKQKGGTQKERLQKYADINGIDISIANGLYRYYNSNPLKRFGSKELRELAIEFVNNNKEPQDI